MSEHTSTQPRMVSKHHTSNHNETENLQG